MIRTHDFNTEWWGSPVGIVDDPQFFDLPQPERERLLSPYAWVEFRAPLKEGGSLHETIGRAGFFFTDVQIPLQVNLDAVADARSIEGLAAYSADERPFDVAADQMAAFRRERFFHLPGVTAAKVNERYALWGKRLIKNDPAACLAILQGDAVQGWFLCSRPRREIDLTLAMLHRDAAISGSSLYRKALRTFAARGDTVATSSFSVANPAVMNIFAHLGAHFLTPIGYWLWVRNPA
jgi:hypothetical protein